MRERWEGASCGPGRRSGGPGDGTAGSSRRRGNLPISGQRRGGEKGGQRKDRTPCLTAKSSHSSSHRRAHPAIARRTRTVAHRVGECGTAACAGPPSSNRRTRLPGSGTGTRGRRGGRRAGLTTVSARALISRLPIWGSSAQDRVRSQGRSRNCRPESGAGRRRVGTTCVGAMVERGV